MGSAHYLARKNAMGQYLPHCSGTWLSRVTICKAVFYTLYTTDQMGSNGRISVINKKKQNALK